MGNGANSRSLRAALALVLVASSLHACGGDDVKKVPPPALTIELDIPAAGPDPFDNALGMVTLQLSATRPGLTQPIVDTVTKGTPTITLDELTYGDGWVLTVKGYNGQNELVAQGQSAPFKLEADSPRVVRVRLFTMERFNPLEGRLGVARFGHTASLLPDGSVLVAGGFTADGRATDRVEIYDPTSDSFRDAPPLSRARGGHQALMLDNGSVALVGGSAQGSVEVYAWANGNTQEIALSIARERPFVGMLADKTIVVAGGLDGNKPTGTTELVDPVAGARSNGPDGCPEQYGGFAFLLNDGRLVAAGGRMGPPGDLGMGSRLFDGSAWSGGSSLVAGVEDARAVVTSSGEIVILGGSDDNGAVRQVQKYDQSQNAFVEAGSTTARFVGAAVTAMGERVMIAGGANGPEVEIWRSGAVQPAGSLVQARQQFTLTPLGDGRVVAIGGKVGSNEVTDESEIFIPRP